MPNRLRVYHRPTDLPTALSLLQSPHHHPLNLSPRPPLEPFANAEAVVDLSGLNLDRLSETVATISIGGQTTLQAMADSPILRHLANDLLPQAIKYVAQLGLRHVATLSATLASPDSSPELLLALLALHAQVVVQGKKPRTVSLMDYAADPDDLLIEVNFARPIAAQAAIARVARTPRDAAIVAAVAVVTPHAATIAVGGASPQPLVLQSAQPNSLPDAILAAANPIPDYRGSAEYRQAMAGVLAHRALTTATQGRQL